MRRFLFTIVLAVSVPTVMYFSLSASASDQEATTPHADTRLLLSPSVEAMPPPQPPFDETPTTPVESAGAPMWS